LSSWAYLCLDPDTLAEEEQEKLRSGLESAAGLLRQVSITFNDWEEQ
jgi:hypothetical protein